MSNVLTDDVGRFVTCPEFPQRIISLCPSLTYSLVQLGGYKQLAGKTRFCIHPAEINAIPEIGGVMGLDKDKIHQLEPDLILAVKEENKKDEVLSLAGHYPVFVFDVRSVQQNAAHLAKLTELCRLDRDRLDGIVSSFPLRKYPESDKRCLYLIWKNPWMGVGPDTYTGSVLEFFGFPQASFDGAAYPQLVEDQLEWYDRIFLSSEPYPFGLKDQQELQRKFPGKEIMLVRGEMFSWFGAWFAKTQAYLQALK